MSDRLAETHERQGLRAHEQLLQAAVVEIGDEQAVERDQHRQQCGNPQYPGAAELELLGARPDGQREQRADHGEEEQRIQHVAGPLPGQQQVAPRDRHQAVQQAGHYPLLAGHCSTTLVTGASISTSW